MPAAADTVSIVYPLLLGLAMFLASNIVSLPVGFISGFREARKHPLSDRAAMILEAVESAAELAVLIGITVKLIRTSSGNPFMEIALAYGVLIALEGTALHVLKLSTPAKWLRILMGVSAAIAIAVAVA